MVTSEGLNVEEPGAWLVVVFLFLFAGWLHYWLSPRVREWWGKRGEINER